MKKALSLLAFLLSAPSVWAQVDFLAIQEQTENSVSTVPRDKNRAATQLQQGQTQVPGFTPQSLLKQQGLGNFYQTNPEELTTEENPNATEPGKFLQQSYNLRPPSLITPTSPLLSAGNQIQSNNSNLICLDPASCFDTSSPKEPNLAPAASHISALNAIQNDHTTNPLVIFKGDPETCRTPIESGVTGDCCSVDSALSSCRSSEQLLQGHRNADTCVEIGTYCSSTLNLGFTSVCIERTTSFCCFKSKLTRIIQQQGRPQLGIAWGSPESPNCRGFTPEELQRIDFSRIDFSEYYSNITVKPIDTNALTRQTKNSSVLHQQRPPVNTPIGVDPIEFQHDLGSTVQSHAP